MKGPCLCGDPYCPWCGDSSLAAHEAAIDKLFDELQDASPDFIEMLTTVVKRLSEAFEKSVGDRVSDATSDDAMYISQLEDQIERSKEELNGRNDSNSGKTGE